MVRKPEWLKKEIPPAGNIRRLNRLLSGHHLHTVCREARCPNRPECFHRGTATFLLLGDTCTRNCRFCAVKTGNPQPQDPDEPGRVARAVQEMNLSYIVLTSVTRDDLPDGGASQFNRTVRRLRERIPGLHAEVLIPDFQGSEDALEMVVRSGPSVLNHNVETVPSLYEHVRPEADYQRSLDLLKHAHERSSDLVIKSGLMLGFGENRKEVVRVMEDLLNAGCRVLTLGQYLQPSSGNIPVARYLAPEVFDHFRRVGLSMGFAEVVSGPFVRSSFQAAEAFEKASTAFCSNRGKQGDESRAGVQD